MVAWYLTSVYGVDEGPGTLPFYCDPGRVGHFFVTSGELRAGTSSALFRLFVTLAMYQARRDVVIMQQQRSMGARAVPILTSLATISRRIRANTCAKLASPQLFDSGCNVAKANGEVDCAESPGLRCHVKDATVLFNRTGDMGKLPTSAWLHAWQKNGLENALERVLQSEPNPARRADLLVQRFSKVHRVGRKLATMFVSALSVPALAPGLTPWFPAVDGNDLVVIDTHVARAVVALRPGRASNSYAAHAYWLRKQAAKIDLSLIRPGLQRFSPRIVQQALYAFGSRSNRAARNDACAPRDLPCETCVARLCPFSGSEAAAPTRSDCA